MRLRDNSVAEMSSSVPRIAAIRGAPNRAIQDALRRFAHRWTDRGVQIAGLIETLDDMAEPTWQAVRLQNIRSGETYPLFQNRTDGRCLSPAGRRDCRGLRRHLR